MSLHDEVKKAGGLMSLADIARDYDVSHQAVRKWRERDDWPDPVGVIGAGTRQPVEVFLARDYRKWAGERYKEQMAAGRAREAQRSA